MKTRKQHKVTLSSRDYCSLHVILIITIIIIIVFVLITNKQLSVRKPFNNTICQIIMGQNSKSGATLMFKKVVTLWVFI